MGIGHIRRGLFLVFLVQEAVIFLRTAPQERQQAPIPPYPALFGIAMLAPFFVTLPLPRWVERLALTFQALGWLLEVAAMIQLARRRSFGIHPSAAAQALQQGLYRFEHPIYLGILLNVLGWTLPLPPSGVAAALLYVAFRRAVRRERVHLASFQIRHRGLDSFLWPEE